MKRFSLLFFSVCCLFKGALIAQDIPHPAPTIAAGASFQYHYFEDFETPLAYGIGLEASLGKRFSINGTVAFGGSNRYDRIFINPSLRFYPKSVFKGFFLYAGLGFHQIESEVEFVPVGYPFDTSRGDEVSFLDLNVGLGVSTLVKNHWNIGFLLGLGAPFDADLYGASIQSSLFVKYAL